MSITIINKTKAQIPEAPFEQIKDEILGKEYELSLAIVDSSYIHKLNLQYRNKDVPTDILSFPLSASSGEIYICPEETKKMAPDFKRNYDNFFVYLFIHGCTHLKGFDHSDKMEAYEAKLHKKFGV